jgi:hypothetical protein
VAKLVLRTVVAQHEIWIGASVGLIVAVVVLAPSALHRVNGTLTDDEYWRVALLVLPAVTLFAWLVIDQPALIVDELSDFLGIAAQVLVTILLVIGLEAVSVGRSDAASVGQSNPLRSSGRRGRVRLSPPRSNLVPAAAG